jgi:hypothetical protein
MQGLISFHPVATTFFEHLLGPLFRGEKVDSDPFLKAAARTRRSAWQAKCYKLALEALLADLDPPPLPTDGTLWDKVKAWLNRFDYRPPPLAPLAAATVQSELHLHGRPFLVTEDSARRTAQVVKEYTEAWDDDAVRGLILDQLIRLDARLARELEPDTGETLEHDMSYAGDVLRELRSAIDAVRAAQGREGVPVPAAGGGAIQELPRRLVELHSRAVPFWFARDVDGLATLCSNVGIEHPAWLRTAADLFATASERLPGFDARLRLEMQRPGDLGAYVEPGDVPRLLEFLDQNGAAIIRAAARCGVGPDCRMLLRKIRECAAFAELQGGGYLEASGIAPPFEELEEPA